MRLKKIISIILIVITLIILNFALIGNCVQAVENGQIYLYGTKIFDRMLKYDGVLLKVARVVYSDNGKEYPAYCMNVELPGIELDGYEVTNTGKITDLGLWRVMINAYPYKTFEELGVVNEDEAYTATKQAIYCYLCGRQPEKYSGIGESGIRTANAIKTILENAKNSTETFEQHKFEINKNEDWKKEGNYITKEYEIKSLTNISKYSVQLEEQPKGCKITDLDGQEKNEFNSSEKFKISIPIESLERTGSFKIYIKTQMKTKPILYGKAPNANVQNYALTGYTFEDIEGQLEDKYPENETEIKIEKTDENGQKLQGAVFEILNEQKEVIKTVTTDEKGLIILDKILPGKYYIKEVKAPEGFEKNEEILEVDVNLNEKIEITITNSKIVIEPVQEIQEEVKKLPVTGM